MINDPHNPANDDFDPPIITPLPEDGDPPSTPAPDERSVISDDNQLTDTDMDSHEVYDAGVEVASGVVDQDETNQVKNVIL